MHCCFISWNKYTLLDQKLLLSEIISIHQNTEIISSWFWFHGKHRSEDLNVICLFEFCFHIWRRIRLHVVVMRQGIRELGKPHSFNSHSHSQVLVIYIPAVHLCYSPAFQDSYMSNLVHVWPCVGLTELHVPLIANLGFWMKLYLLTVCVL